uniref:F-box domain-containing protein n=1 Tax=Caenorhabditis tropicalis TaxID=1561998 RepID=A0A1I7TVL0_9PELO
MASLISLSSKAVAKYLIAGCYKHLDSSLGEPLSDKVFDEVATYKHKVSNFRSSVSSIIAKQSGLKLNLTRFDSYLFFVNRFDLENLYLHNIQSLDIDFGWFCGVTEYIIEYRGEKGILDAVRILKRCLNEKSRQNLKKLGIGRYLKLQENWIEEVGKLFPNLRGFACRFEDEKHFERACKSFPNLFSFASSYRNDLRGLCHLKNLQILILDGSSVNSPEELRELFELPNLRILKASFSQGFFENLLRCDGTFKNLQYIECRQSDITETQFRALVGRHPSIKAIAALNKFQLIRSVS